MELVRRLSIDALQTLINRYLALDPSCQQKLQPLIGKQFLLEVTDINAEYYISFQEGIVISNVSTGDEVDLVIRGATFSLWKLFQSTPETFSAHLQSVRVVGDLNLAQSIKVFFNSIDIDWEEQLSRLTGDVFAHQFFRGVKALRAWRQEALKGFKLNLKEYLQEEARYFPTSEELAIFLQEVDVLRDDIERLEAKIERLGRSDELH